MKHEIDLSKFNLYTDLTIDKIEDNNIKIDKKIYIKNDIKITNINIDKESSKIINKDIGNYITIEFNDITDSTNQNKLIKVLSNELDKLININSNDLVLIVGLGNEVSTPDSLGPKVIDNIIVTNHIYELGLLENKYTRVCSIKPSVYAKTGIESSIIIESIIKRIKPNLVIIIDSLASSTLSRLNKTIEINNIGISPGSGIGNNRRRITSKNLKTNIIALGVPTVVSANTLVYELTNSKKIKNNNLVVTPTEIDFIIDCLSKIISKSINKSLNNN